jgi:hypothetical protein
MYGMVVFGVGEVSGGLYGLLIDKIGSRKTIFVNISIICLTFGVTFLSV